MLLNTTNLERWFAEARRDGNPLLTAWFALMANEEARLRLFTEDRTAWKADLEKSLHEGTHGYQARKVLVCRYAWAVPCCAALIALSGLGPLVEIGAGTGYWAWLLRQRGTDILCYDLEPPAEGRKINHYHCDTPTWVAVQRGGPEMAACHPDRTLFLCWPPYANPMAARCLDHYQGRTLAVIGEGPGGCTADDRFFEMLEADWVERQTVDLPQFDGLHDYLAIFDRK